MNFSKLKLNSNLIKRPKNDNKAIYDADNKFMSGSFEQDMAVVILQMRIDENMFNCQEEFIDYCRRRGYLKTEKDKQIVEHLLYKNRQALKSNEMEYIKTKQGEWLRKKRIRAIVETATKQNEQMGQVLERIIKEEYKIL